MDWLFITTGILLLLAGLVGAVAPGLPGPPLSFFALVMLQLKVKPHSGHFLIFFTDVYNARLFLCGRSLFFQNIGYCLKETHYKV
jgi:uncharacterized protein YqgC (DUF456 family)